MSCSMPGQSPGLNILAHESGLAHGPLVLASAPWKSPTGSRATPYPLGKAFRPLGHASRRLGQAFTPLAQSQIPSDPSLRPSGPEANLSDSYASKLTFLGLDS